MSFKHYAMQEAKQQFVEYDKNSDGSVSWDEYNIQMYDRVIDFDENTALEDAEEESFRQVSTLARAFLLIISVHFIFLHKRACSLRSDRYALFSGHSPVHHSCHFYAFLSG